MSEACVWCGQPGDAHGPPGVSEMGGPEDRLCPATGVTGQFFTPRRPQNDLWQDVPDGAGYWWGVCPRTPHRHHVARVFPQPGRMDAPLRIWMAGDRRDYPVDHFVGRLVWQKAITPIYSWPSPDYDP